MKAPHLRRASAFAKASADRRLRLFTVALFSVTLAAQQRDSRVAPVGAGEIAGVIMSADQDPKPVRRVVVTLTAAELPGPRSVITDDDGRFVFARLPAGSYAVTARKAAFLESQFGSPKPGRPGTRIALAAGERRALTVTLFRGAAIGGTLRDETGAPLAGVSITALDARAVAGNATTQAGGTAITDDRGRYRIYSLPPGEYVLSAAPTPGGSGEIAASTSSDVDAALAALTQRQNGTVPAQVANAQIQALPTPRSVGYAPTYFPGTAFYPDAGRVRVGAGDSRDGIDFPITHVPVASIDGVISGGVANLATVLIAITPDGPRTGAILGAGSITSRPPNANGEFQYGNLTPGRYRIVARSRAGGEPAPQPGVAMGGLRGGAPPAGTVLAPTGEMLYAVADVDVRGQNVTGVSLPLQPGGNISGKVVFDASAAPLPDDLTGFRVQISLQGGAWSSASGTTRMGPAISSIPPVSLRDDGSFLIQGVGPGQYVLSCQVPADVAPFWKPRSAIHEGRDLFDLFIDGPNVQMRDVVITLSDKRTEIAGQLQSASGQPATDYYVIAFSADRALWRPGARRSQSARPSTDGRYVFTDLPAGEYLIAALTDLDPAEWQDPAFLDQIAPAAIKVTLAEGEKKRTDIRIK